MNEDLSIILQWIAIGFFIWIAFKAYKYSRFKVLLDTTYTTNGFNFKIHSTYKRKFHPSKKRRHIMTTIILGEKVLPNIFLDSHYEDKYLYATEYASYDQNQRVSLEGDFDKFFQLYVPKGMEREALTLVTPDVMLILRDKLSKADMLIESHNIILKSHTIQEVDSIKAGIQEFLDKISRAYKYISIDDQIYYSKTLTIKNTVDEAVKIRTRLISTKTLTYWLIFLFPAILYILFYVFMHEYLTSVTFIGFLKGLIVSMVLGLIGVLILEADERGIINLRGRRAK